MNKTDPTSDREIYYPDEDLKFDSNGRLLLYRCRDEALKQ